jgi:hypothetical protein
MANKPNKLLVIAGKIAEALGSDLVPYALGIIKFSSAAPFQPTKLQEIQGKLTDITGVKVIDDALSYCKELLDDENERGDKIESKAFNLIGVTGISTAFITGVTSLVTDNASLPFWLIPSLYILIVVSLTLTVLLAFRVIRVGEYKHTQPDIADVFNMNLLKLEDIKKRRIATYLHCYARNCQVHNIKASYLIGSQIWFRNAVVLFLLLAFTLAVDISHDSTTVSPSANPTISTIPTGTAVFTLAPIPITPTFTLTPVTTNIQNVVLPTQSPTSAAVQLPLPTATHSPSPSQIATTVTP